jgi:hypothetical protein
MIPNSQLAGNPQPNQIVNYDGVDEFMRQILSKLLLTPDSLLGGSATKPIFRGFKLIHTVDDEQFNLNINSESIELFVSFERDFNGSNRRELACGLQTSPTYNIYFRLLIDGQSQDKITESVWNCRQRMTQVIDSMIMLLTNNQANQDGYITSVINTDIANIDPLIGRKYITNFKFNKIETNSRFEIEESLNEKNYYTGGFSYVLNCQISDKNSWGSTIEAESYNLY